jgi:hypothetical protein
MMTVGSGPARRDRIAAGQYVLGRRTPEGGYCFYRTPEWGVEQPNAPDTLAALESLRLLGITIPAAAQTGQWLRSLQDERGDYPTVTIGWAALCALDVLALTPIFSPDQWLGRRTEALAGHDRSGDLRSAIIDALRLVELVHLRHGTLGGRERQGIATLLDAARAPRGGWARPGADLETTAIGMRLAQLADVRWHPDPQLAAFLCRCEDELLGLRLAPNTRATSVGALWGGLTLSRVLRQRLRYVGAIGAQLALLQRPDGGLGERHWAISTLQATWRGLETARLLAGLNEEEQP